MEYHSAVRINEFYSYTIASMNLKLIMLSESSQILKKENILRDLSKILESVTEPIVTETRLVVAWWKGGGWEGQKKALQRDRRNLLGICSLIYQILRLKRVVTVCHYTSIKLLKEEKIKSQVNDVQYLIGGLIKDHGLGILFPIQLTGQWPKSSQRA